MLVLDRKVPIRVFVKKRYYKRAKKLILIALKKLPDAKEKTA